jgi:hypothetical protein
MHEKMMQNRDMEDIKMQQEMMQGYGQITPPAK